MLAAGASLPLLEGRLVACSGSKACAWCVLAAVLLLLCKGSGAVERFLLLLLLLCTSASSSDSLMAAVLCVAQLAGLFMAPLSAWQLLSW